MVDRLRRAWPTVFGRWRAAEQQAVMLQGAVPVGLPGPWAWGKALDMHSQAGDGDLGQTRAGALLTRLKYEGERPLAAVLGRAIGELIAGDAECPPVEVVVHAPTAGRGRFEPARELASAVARSLRVRCLPALIARARWIHPQKDLEDWDDKVQNVAGAFRVRRPDLVKGRSVLVVDDVYDSGATLGEACRALEEAGVSEIAVATVTRTRYRERAAV